MVIPHKLIFKFEYANELSAFSKKWYHSQDVNVILLSNPWFSGVHIAFHIALGLLAL